MGSHAKPLHILSSSQFDRDFLDYMCLLTDTIRRFDKSKEGLMYLKGLLAHKRAMLYFTQPSTRTFLSFQSACNIIGMPTSEIRDSSTSSERKGESIEDSLRTFSSYVDLIIMRTATPGLCDRIAAYLDETERPVPIINAGSGPDEHPTQALLDIYTLNRSFIRQDGIDGKTITLVGDLKRGRTVRSLSSLLTNYQDVSLRFVSPPEFRIEDDLRTLLTEKGVKFEETDHLVDALAYSDAIYMTRVQDEYDSDNESASVDTTRFHLKAQHLKHMKDSAVIMHPLPRRNELDVEIDKDPRAKYWRQERNGMWTRVALLTKILGVDRKIVLPEL
ncbi:aspartate carbamoyltransferase [Pseudobacteriovorax antillogorgiicola]|uniref:Aspartate carbamoyltransferase n=1 Tax=Pseudobacteriovorax antillogorgiicola TaxID=1513793 RepID=A0A1Y6CKT7_9BACT|nr:aspartate carbamoyltransferase [Pseudobacteriovorax antillogorgiicola]TCS46175.1 aspartate carbamoyltransferase [Pseudobacteriovorax antillogorgiicola]SMF69997.1 aspartate carbamoyltransferase [Pseudobacteriovorax antillogorgiicola]